MWWVWLWLWIIFSGCEGVLLLLTRTGCARVAPGSLSANQSPVWCQSDQSQPGLAHKTRSRAGDEGKNKSRLRAGAGLSRPHHHWDWATLAAITPGEVVTNICLFVCLFVCLSRMWHVWCVMCDVMNRTLTVLCSKDTGCLKKNARLRLEAYNSSLEAAVGACRDIFGFLRFSAFIWAQEVQDSVHGSLRKSCLKRATLPWK